MGRLLQWPNVSPPQPRGIEESGDEASHFSPESEGVGLDTGIEEADLERAIGDGTILPNQLVKAVPGHNASPLGIDIGTMAVAGRHAIDRDPEPAGLAVSGAENEMEIASMEPVDDAALLAIEVRPLFAYRPIPRQAPFIEVRLAGGVDMRAAFDGAAR